MNNQDILRNQVKELRWKEDITFKEIAIDLLDMDYHAFINWLHGRSNLGIQRAKKLEDYINCIL